MKRWHEEVPLMTRRWRKELAKHGSGHPHAGWMSYPYDSLAPPSLACEVGCHCSQGIGTMRKRTLGCGNVRCGVCHFHKYYLPKNRANIKRKAIEDQLL